MKPLEIKDFSGGETDNYFQGEPNRAQKLINLLIGIDHKTYSRPGTLVQPNAKKTSRINSIETFNSYEDLVYSSEGHFYQIDGTEIFGPSGNIAFVGATDQAVYTSAEMQGHLLLSCDEILQPQKIYIDQNGDYQVREIGLPKVTTPITTDSDLLNACIAAANSLRTNFLAHINSAENTNSERDGTSPAYSITTEQPVTSTNAHWSIDKYAKCYLTSVSFTTGQWQPNTIPTPAPAATDYNSLVTLIQALNLAFEEHRQDSAGFASISDSGFSSLISGPNRYHALGYQSQYTDGTTNFGFPYGSGFINLYAKPMNQGIQQRVVENPDPNSAINASIDESKVYRTKLIQIAKFLDDFAVKFALHETAPFVHRYNYQNAQGNTLVDAAFSYQFLAPLLSEVPVVISTPFNFIYAANFTNRAFTNHANNTDIPSSLDASFPTMHATSNSSIVSGLQAAGYYFAQLPSNPTVRQQYTAFAWDVILAKILIFNARYAYFIHNLDLYQGAQIYKGTATATGANAVFIPTVTTGVKGQILQSGYQVAIDTLTKKRSFNGILAYTGSNNYTTNYNTGLFPNSTVVSLGSFVMHPYGILTSNSSYSGYAETSQNLTSFGYAPDIYDLASWTPLIEGFYDAFKAHELDPNVHYHTTPAFQEFQPTPPGQTYPAGGVQYFPLSSLLPTVNLPGAQPQFIIPEIKSYGYAWTYSDTYTINSGVSYKVESAPIFSDPVNSEETLAVGVVKQMYGETSVYLINQIVTPVAMLLGADPLTNDSTTNYSNNILLNTYRTLGNGTSYFHINTLAATPLVIPAVPKTINLLGDYDLVSDVYAINGNIPLDTSEDILYTNGGVTPSNTPTKSKYLWKANDYAYYAGVYDGDTYLPYRVLQSVQLAPDWVPSQNFVDFDAPVVGGGAARNVNVCLTETGVYRLEGAFGLDGSGAIVKQQIHNKIGGINGASVVVTDIGLFFAATNGFYYTDGYECFRISQERNVTYRGATITAEQKRQIKGSYDRTNRRVYWSVRSSSGSADNDALFVFDINFGIGPSGTFTTLVGADNSWNPSAIAFYTHDLFIGDTDGYLYNTDDSTKTDPYKDTLNPPNTWDTTYVPWEWRSTMMDFGGTAMRKFFSRIHHVGKNRGDVAIQYYICADNVVTQNLAPMRFIDDGGQGNVDQWRRVGGKKLRADLYQIGCKNGRFTVYNSDTYPNVPIFVSNTGGKTTLRMVGTILPTDTERMSICFATDNYSTEFLVVSTYVDSGNTMLVVNDATNKVNGLLALQWEIRGFMKDQAFSLDALTIWFEEQGNLGSQYRGYSSDQGGGGNK